MEDKRCLSMDSEYELAVHGDNGKRNGELSLFEKSLKPVSRRQVRTNHLQEIKWLYTVSETISMILSLLKNVMSCYRLLLLFYLQTSV